MEIEILYQPSYSLGIVKLAPNEQIRAEAGAMVSMSEGVNIETKAAGGLLKSLGRAVLGGESFFQNFFTAPAQGGEITFAPDLPGDLFVLTLNNDTLFIQSGSYVASELGIELSTKLSTKAFLATEGFSILEAKGSGKILLSAYGAIHEKVLNPGEKFIVDSTHLVAFDARMPVQPKTVGGLKATFLSGEGFVVELTGPGRLLMQTRSQKAFLDWLTKGFLGLVNPQNPEKGVVEGVGFLGGPSSLRESHSRQSESQRTCPLQSCERVSVSARVRALMSLGSVHAVCAASKIPPCRG